MPPDVNDFHYNKDYNLLVTDYTKVLDVNDFHYNKDYN